MIFLKLILTNLARHRIRTLMSVAGIAFSVALMLTVVTILQGAVGMFSGLLSKDSQIIVFEKNVSDLFFSSVPNDAVKEIGSWSSVKHAWPMLFGVVTSSDHPIITCFGITPDDARLQDAQWVAGDRADFAKDPNGVLLGQRAADFLHAHEDSTVAIGNGTFRVVGVLKLSNGFEDGGVFMPLATAQSFFHRTGQSSVITIDLKNRDQIAAFKREVAQHYPDLIALKNQEFDRSYTQFRILKATAWAVGICGLILGGLGVANTMIMSVFTRIREIAILRVNGFSNRQIAAVIFGESGVVSAAGALVGLVFGAAAVYALKAIPALHGYVNAQMQPLVMLLVVVLACATGIAGALYPAFYATRVRAVEALRFE
jgi:putative ABC transport system permease protein